MDVNPDRSAGIQSSKWRMAFWSGAGLLMLLPALAMQVSDEVAWDAVDFVILGALLAGVGIVLELTVRRTASVAYRSAVAVALAAAFALIGANAAVGLIGAAHDDANLMFGGVLAVGIIGAVIARFRPTGMAHAMVATALAQVLVAVTALVAGLGAAGPIWPWDILGAAGVFAALWLVSARLFRRAAS